MAWPKGRPKPRKNGPRGASGRLLRINLVASCACGQPKTAKAQRCQSCAFAARRQMHRCEYCDAEFWRSGGGGDSAKDSLRFCSKRCYGALRTAIMCRRKQHDSAERAIERELKRAAQHALHSLRVCGCGAPLDRPTARYCRVCYQHVIGVAIRNGRTKVAVDGVQHCCPNCGQWFRGYEGDVYCSSPCAKMSRRQTRAYKRRYPTLRHVPLAERNQLAELLALVRQAHQRIDQVNKGGEGSQCL